MRFRVLGPLEVADDGRAVALGGPKQRLVLALLLLRANEPVGADQLIDEIWGEEPPDGARGTLQSYVSHLRKALGPGRIEGGAFGYRLSVEPSNLDALRFEELVREARRALPRDPTAGAEALAQALALWRGRALSDIADEPALRPDITRLEELRVAALEDRAEAELALGRHAELVPELQSLIERHSLRERLWGHLMLAMYRSGRQAEALDAFARARQGLNDELGIDPSAELQRLHEQILRQDPALDIGGRPLRGYRLIDQIGEGAFGAVHRAIQPQVGREVAVKAAHPWLANHPDFIRRFETEAQLVARLEHPHIVPLYDYWREPDAAYLVMRFMRGGSLKKVLAREALDAEAACRVVEQIGAALGVGHRMGIVHRDVKPANVLFDEERNAYLSDFGIARDLTRSAAPPGTPVPLAYYTSPEELRGEEVTPRSDVYALGILAYEMLAGRAPFDDETDEGTLRRAPRPLPSIRLQRPDVPAGLDEVLARATASDPTERYGEAAEFASALRRALEPDAAPSRVVEWDVRNPYKGLRPFLEADAADFFGRDALVERLVTLMRDGSPTRLVAVVGPSGSGKSSAVRAGLVPALRRGALPGSERWFAVEMVPGANPFEELERAMLRIAVHPPARLIELLERDDHGLIGAANAVLPEDRELVLVVDQFEELFTLVQDEQVRKAFLDRLAVAATDPRSRVRVVVTLRADFYDRPLIYRGFGELLAARTQAVTPLSTEELERAVSGPAERVGVAVEPRLLADIVAEVADHPGSLPLLEYALTELFERRSDSVLTLEAYRAVGGVSRALVRRAEQLYSALDEPGRGACRQAFLRLLSVAEEGVEDTRRRALRAELSSLDVDAKAMDRVVEAFGRHRLLSFDRDPVTRGPTVEVAHEALLREWERLRGWIEAARSDLRMQRRLAVSAVEWEAAERDRSFLLRGARLGQVEMWASASDLALSRSEREYLEASLERRDAEQVEEAERAQREATLERRSLRRMRALVAVLAIAATLAASLSLVAVGQRRRAQSSAAVAAARELTAASLVNLDVDPERSILLGLEAVRAYREAGEPVSRDVTEALHLALGRSRVLLSIPTPGAQVDISRDGSFVATTGTGHGTNPYDAAIWDAKTGERRVTMTGHTDHVSEVDISPDGTRLLTASDDKTAIIWDVATGARLRTLPHSDSLNNTSYGADGKTVATSSDDGIVRIWDATSGRVILTFTNPEPAPAIAERPGDVGFCTQDYNSAVHLIVAANCFTGEGQPWNVSVFDTRNGRRTTRIPGHDPWTVRIALSPDGRLAATTGVDGTARVWSTRTKELLATMAGARLEVDALEFSPDGTVLATVSVDSSARLWDVRTGRELIVLRGHREVVQSVAFDGSGTRLATGSSDGTVRVWDVGRHGGSEAFSVSLGIEPVGSTWFDESGSRLLAAGGAVGLWDARSGAPVAAFPGFGGRPVVVDTARFVPGGKQVVVAGRSGTTARVAVWDVAAGAMRAVPVPAGSYPTKASAALSPDGRHVAIGGREDGQAFVLSLSDPGAPPLLAFRRTIGGEQFFSEMAQVSFNPDGTKLLTAILGGDAAIFSIPEKRQLFSISVPSYELYDAAYDPGGKRFVTSIQDGTAVVWDAVTGSKLVTLKGHEAGLAVRAATFSPDGKMVATASDDDTVRLWDAGTGEELLKITGQTTGFRAVAFSPDGSRLAAGTADGIVRVYLLDIDDLVETARARLTRGLTDDECDRYLHIPRCS